jgi:molecular chaperone GrpE (heat shock protein)
MPDDFKIPSPQWPDEKRVIDALTKQIKSILSSQRDAGTTIRYAVPEKFVKSIADVATNAWKARTKMMDGSSGEVREDMKRVHRHIEAMFESFREMGLEIKDHTGEIFDYGLPLNVVTTQPTPGITKERVLETLKPTIYWQEQMIQMGEVVIATPA